MKKFLASMEIVLALLMAAAGCVLHFKITHEVSGEKLGGFAEAAESYQLIVQSSRELYEKAYSTIPQHRKVVTSVCEQIDKFKATCDKLEDDLPHQIDHLPGEFYKPVGEFRKSAVVALELLDSFDQKKHEQILDAMEKTSRSLNDAAHAIRLANATITGISLALLILVLSAGACFIINGILILMPEKHN